MRRKEKTQKMKFRNRVMAFAAVLVMMLSLISAVPVQAENIAPTTNLTTTFKKYLVMDENANVPDVTFGFTITAGQPVLASGTDPAIYAGIDADRVKVGNAEFAPTDDTKAGLPTDSSTVGKKYASKEVTIDFGSISFKNPGIYRYIITETSVEQDGIKNDTDSTRTLDVYVGYKKTSENPLTYSDTELEIMGYVLHNSDKANPESGDKSDGFTNEYVTNNLELQKVVTGNQGDRDKYFEFTVEITSAVKGTVYTVDLQNADANPTVDGNAKTNPKTLTATDGAVTATYYLKDDQSIVIQGLTAGTKYTITETAYTRDGYKTSYVIDSNASVDGLSTASQTMGTDNHEVTFTNHKEGTVPTGILLETAPYIVLGVVVLVGLAILFMTGRRRVR